MPRTRRYIRAKRTYELIIRTFEGLPFPPTSIIRLLFESAIARAQRNYKVRICHLLVMSNHVHILLVVQDAELCAAFYQEVQKKVTEGIKRLTGRKKLRLWEGDPVLAEILDPDKMVERIAYLYCNPSRADLVSTIEEYPGLSTWKEFLASDSTKSVISKSIPWIRLPSIKPLTTLSISPARDLETCLRLRNNAKDRHVLDYEPNAWLETFGITDDIEMERYRCRTLSLVREREKQARLTREGNQKICVGRSTLVREPIFKPHTPAPRIKRIFVLSSVKELRDAYILAVKKFCTECANCYRKFRAGQTDINWPPGAFRPCLRPLANAL